MKKFKSIIALLLTIVTAFMTGCSGTETSDMNVDDSLRSLAQSQAEGLVAWEDLKGGLELVKQDNRYELVDVLSKNTVYYIDDVEMFYESEDPYVDFVFEKSKCELDLKVWENLEKAKKLACGYIDESNEFCSDEKETLKETVCNVTVCYGTVLGFDFDDMFTITPMRTHNSTIYLTDGAEDYFTVATFLHELIHVISNVTNAGSVYENSFYRFSAINEGMTELISQQILVNAGLEDEIMDEVTYTVYFPFVFALLDKVDLIHGYFYSEDFDYIFEDIERDWIDVYYMLVAWCPKENLKSNNAYAYWAYSQF